MQIIPNRLLKRICITAISLGMLSGCHAEKALNPSGFHIQRGVNLSHWLSQCEKWAPRETFITENDIHYIASIGFDHVRLPIDEKEMWYDDNTPNEEAFGYLQNAISWCIKHDLKVVVDLHVLRSHHFNAANDGTTNTLWVDPKAQEHFVDLWKQLSARLAHFPNDVLAYEPMNEPVAPNHDDWNKLIARAHQAIRKNEPERVLIFGSNLWQIPETISALNVPKGDKNIILSTHTYSPFVFTHYTAGWTPLKFYRGKVSYPGKVVEKAEYDRLMAYEGGRLKDLVGDSNLNWNREQLRKKFAPAIQRASELGLQLYCGEYGCLPAVPRQDRIQYYDDITAVMEEAGMAWANWEYKGDFGIFEWHASNKTLGAPDLELIKVLVGD